MTTYYRIRLKGTEWYYCPSRKINNMAGYRVKSNLSAKGKLYNMHPALGWVGPRYYSHLHEDTKSTLIDTSPKDWEIEAIELRNKRHFKWS